MKSLTHRKAHLKQWSKKRHSLRLKKSTRRAIKHKTRRIIRRRKSIRKSIRKSMRGGAETVAVIKPYSSTYGGNTPQQNNDMKADYHEQNQGNMALKGGARHIKYKKQKGGTLTSSVLNLYNYIAPPGMMGPVPQPSQNEAANNLIKQAAVISTSGQANSQYDKQVNNVVKT